MGRNSSHWDESNRVVRASLPPLPSPDLKGLSWDCTQWDCLCPFPFSNIVFVFFKRLLPHFHSHRLPRNP